MFCYAHACMGKCGKHKQDTDEIRTRFWDNPGLSCLKALAFGVLVFAAHSFASVLPKLLRWGGFSSLC